jgi:hypothetical protein
MKKLMIVAVLITMGMTMACESTTVEPTSKTAKELSKAESNTATAEK